MMFVLMIIVGGDRLKGEEPVDWETRVRPILAKYCYGCHGPQHSESMVRLDQLSGNLLEDRAAVETWHEVLNAIDAAEMPPADEPQLNETELTTVTTQLREQLKRADDATQKTTGRVVMRRLNRLEYQNTMADLLGIDMDYARDL
ncbi:MAG: c-type cytochrome domain-containing protein, partial [Planctomycetota bacterium]|nr:c-type cytochrome domain-containing protein [Planctomycetota bacterium]